MKIEKSDGTVTHGNTEGTRKTKMRVSAAAMAHIAKILTTLYNDPESAVFREYLSNALDAHIKSGNTNPVSVFLPTHQTPIFTVTDQGVGMTTVILEDVCSQYGGTTKDDSNDEIGGFGLGFKSALAISSQFTVITVKDGIRTHAIIANSETGEPDIEVVDIRETTDPNGTTVAIPIKDPESFNRKARDYMQYLDEGTVLLGGTTAPKNYKELFSNLFVNETFLSDISTTIRTFEPGKGVYGDYASEGMVLVMGGIRYVIPVNDIKKNLDVSEASRDLFTEMMDVLTVIEAPIGAVKLSPSREGIQFTEKTRKYFNDVFSAASEGLLDSLIAQITDATSLTEAMEAYGGMTQGRRDLVPKTWNGLYLNAKQVLYTEGSLNTATYDRYTERCSYGSRQSFPLTTINTIFVEGKTTFKTLSRHLSAYIRAMAVDGVYPSVTFVGESLRVTDVPTQNRVKEIDDKGFEVRVFEPLTQPQLDVAFPDGIKIVPFEEVREVANQYRRENRKPVSKAARVLVDTKYPIMDYTTATIEMTPLSDINFDDYTEVLFVPDVTRSAGDSGISVFGSAISATTAGSGSIPEAINSLLLDAFGSEILLLPLTGGRKEGPLNKALKALDQPPAKEANLSKVYASVLKSAKIKESDVISYLILEYSDVLKTVMRSEGVVRDPIVRKLTDAVRHKNTEKSLELLALIPPRTTFEKPLPKLAKDIIQSRDMWQGLKNIDSATTARIALKQVYRKYPLLKAISTYSITERAEVHLIDYFNSVHRTDKSKAFTI